jgi:protein TonB
MFENVMLSNRNAGRRAWTTGLGVAGEAAFVGLIALVPVIWPQAMPKPQALLLLLIPPAPIAPARVTNVKPRTVQAPAARAYLDPMTIPRVIPTTIDITLEGPPDVGGSILTAGSPTGGNKLIESILGGVRIVPAPPAVVRPLDTKPRTDSAVPRRIRTSTIELARLIHRVEPIYPAIAKLAHVSGIVEITGIIGIDGHIRELKALSGNPLLIRAALDAVSQWIYAPPVLNGERVEVIAPITVNFLLNR